MRNSQSESEDEEPILFPVRIAQEFIDDLAAIYSERLLEQIKSLVSQLEINPEIGSTQVRPFLTELYGPALRKLPVSTFVIVYRFNGEVVDVLALVYGPTVR